MKTTTRWLLTSLLCLALWPAAGEPQELGVAFEPFVDYYVQLRYREALSFAKETLTLSEKELGPEHPTTAILLDELAGRYRALGLYAEAEPLYERALMIREKALGPDHPDLATSLENYAALLREVGRDAEAAEMEVRAEEIRAKRAEENP